MATVTRAGGAVARVVRSAVAAEATDRELLERFAVGDEAAFATLVARYGSLVHGVCRRVLPTVQDAEDATQAVFLILAKKAAGGRWQSSVANWLYTTARMIAAKANRSARRRTRREARPVVPAAPSALDQMSGREAFAALDAELDRLPPIYREPLVLCHLQGLTRDEAAARLSVPVGTLKTRLERGRKRLADALTKRGIVLGAGLLAIAATSPAGASPSALIASVLAAVNGTPSPTAVALAQGAAVNGFLTRTKVLTLVGLVTVGFGLAAVALAAEPPKGADKKDKKAEPKPTEAKEQTITGTVTGPDGKPVASAKLWLCEPGGLIASKLSAPEHVATTNEQGRFVITRKDNSAELAGAIVAATKDGFGVGVDVATVGEGTLHCSLTLVKDDVPVEGRVIDLQGQPVAGATVRPISLYRTPTENLDAWEQAARRSTKEAALGFHTFFPRSIGFADGPLAGIGEAKTDKNGKFTLTGLGRDRMVTLRVSGPGIATTEIDVVTRAMTTVRTPPDKLDSYHIPRIFYGAKFDYSAEPSQPFVGVVTDKETGKPIPGVVVSRRLGWRGTAQAVTDADGKYRLDGLPTGEQTLIAIPPIDAPYHLRTFKAGRTANQTAVTANVELYRGVWVSGTVTDKATGKPVEASISYRPEDTPGETIPGYSPRGFDDMTWYTAGEDGKFRVLAVPGRGYVFARSDGHLTADQLDWQGDLKDTTPQTYTDSAPAELAVNWNAIALVTAIEGKPAKEYTLVVDPGVTVKARITDPDGKPLAGARVTQRTNFSPFEVSRLDSADVEFERVNPKRPRSLLVLHTGKRLGALVSTIPEAKGTAEIRLQPTASVKGRLVSEDGKPLANTPIEIRYSLEGDFGWRATEMFPEVMTDKDGKFAFPHLIAGVKYELRWPEPAPKKADAYHAFEVRSGEEKDLGDLRGKTDEE